MFCENCGEVFSYEDAIHTKGCYEDDYNLNDGYRTYYSKYSCPYCGSGKVTDSYRHCSYDRCDNYTSRYGLCNSCRKDLHEEILKTFKSDEYWYAYLDDNSRDDLNYPHDIVVEEFGDDSLEDLRKEVK